MKVRTVHLVLKNIYEIYYNRKNVVLNKNKQNNLFLSSITLFLFLWLGYNVLCLIFPLLYYPDRPFLLVGGLTIKISKKKFTTRIRKSIFRGNRCPSD